MLELTTYLYFCLCKQMLNHESGSHFRVSRTRNPAGLPSPRCQAQEICSVIEMKAKVDVNWLSSDLWWPVFANQNRIMFCKCAAWILVSVCAWYTHLCPSWPLGKAWIRHNEGFHANVLRAKFPTQLCNGLSSIKLLSPWIYLVSNTFLFSKYRSPAKMLYGLHWVWLVLCKILFSSKICPIS